MPAVPGGTETLDVVFAERRRRLAPIADLREIRVSRSRPEQEHRHTDDLSPPPVHCGAESDFDPHLNGFVFHFFGRSPGLPPWLRGLGSTNPGTLRHPIASKVRCVSIAVTDSHKPSRSWRRFQNSRCPVSHAEGPVPLNSAGTLVFETIHYDKAGETGDTKVVAAELASYDDAGMALLVTAGGIHVQFPAAHLYPVEPGRSKRTWVAGQSLIRDFVYAVEPTQLRYMERDEALRQIQAHRTR